MVSVRVGDSVPPPAADVSGLMFELMEWWGSASLQLSPVLSSAILHYRFEAIHPFADGNGRTGRALALWELYRRRFDMHHIFSVDEYYWENRPRYYAALESVRHEGEDLSTWLEYCAEGLRQTLDNVWLRVQAFNLKSPQKLVFQPRHQQLLKLLHDHGSMAPAEIWKALDISRQGAVDLIHPLIEVGIIEKLGSKKNGRYLLRQP